MHTAALVFLISSQFLCFTRGQGVGGALGSAAITVLQAERWLPASRTGTIKDVIATFLCQLLPVHDYPVSHFSNNSVPETSEKIKNNL